MPLLKCGKFTLSLERPLVMGIVNVTPDSFADGGLFMTPAAALGQAARLIDEGADLLDIGGESTRPGASPVEIGEELDRIMPVLEGLRDSPVPVSVDTSKPEVMRQAIAGGASMINDVSAFEADGAMEAVAGSDVALCLMHKRGDPRTMQQDPHYQDVVAEVMEYLASRRDAVRAAGVAAERMVVDPGFGFGKNWAHNMTLLRNLDRLTMLHVPIMVGLSRKSMLGKITGREPRDRVYASVAAALLAAERGAAILRVHDVAATKDGLAVFWAMHQGSHE